MTPLDDAPLLSCGKLVLDDAGKRRVVPWADNAELVEEVMRLIDPEGTAHIADVTFGRGVWWKRRETPPAVCHGLDLAGSGEYDDGVDFRALPEDDGTFDIVAFDPPYCAQGGKTKNVEIGDNMNARYGLKVLPATPAGVQTELINPGLSEVHRVLRRGGKALVKVKNYITSGDLWPGEFLTLQHAATLDMALFASYVFPTLPGPQPKGRPQQHPRNNTSALFVLERTKEITT